MIRQSPSSEGGQFESPVEGKDDWSELRAGLQPHVHVLHEPDPSASLAVQIAEVGLARIRFAQELLGDEPSAELYVAPDACPSTNPERSAGGFANGTRISWRPGTRFIPLGFGPNACGMGIFRLDARPDPGVVRDRVSTLDRAGLVVDGVQVKSDLARRNHFAGVFSVSESVDDELGSDYAAVVHCSAPELKAGSALGVGLSIANSVELSQRATRLQTPAGEIAIATGELADELLAYFRRVEEFAAARRLKIAEYLFGDVSCVSDRTHQGVVDMNSVSIGSQFGDRHGAFAYLQGPDCPSFLYSPGASAEVEESDGERSVVWAPHGGGSAYDWLLSSDAIPTRTGVRLRLKTGIGNLLDIPDVAGLPFAYRGRESFDEACELEICDRRAMLTPVDCYRG